MRRAAEVVGGTPSRENSDSSVRPSGPGRKKGVWRWGQDRARLGAGCRTGSHLTKSLWSARLRAVCRDDRPCSLGPWIGPVAGVRPYDHDLHLVACDRAAGLPNVARYDPPPARRHSQHHSRVKAARRASAAAWRSTRRSGARLPIAPVIPNPELQRHQHTTGPRCDPSDRQCSQRRALSRSSDWKRPSNSPVTMSMVVSSK